MLWPQPFTRSGVVDAKRLTLERSNRLDHTGAAITATTSDMKRLPEAPSIRR
jgi:hypothetical protein